MRFISLATVLSAALLPAANARPACRPDKPTTSEASTTAVSVETFITDTATTLEASTTYETTSAVETTALDTTIEISETITSDSTALVPTDTTISEIATTTADATSTEVTTTVAETTSAGIATTTAETTAAETTSAADTTTAETTTSVEIVTTTTEAATTTTAAAAGPTNFVKNSGFEQDPNTAWALQSSSIKNSPGFPHTGNQYLEFTVDNDFALGQQQATQTVSGLDTGRQHHLTLYATIFSTPQPVANAATICFIQAQQGNALITQWRLDFNNLNSYQPFGIDFTPLGSDISLSLKLRCTNGQRVTLALGIDDVTIELSN
ncbi:hypothetical protein FVEN_g7690 [Fusarium venenatum]|uniref:CBM-cenC domain-containing protein n=1 Tax=Fusarium venenatum TaxID=56646 RepID=A0A2L2TQ72_9HYPO|nr:uncharacterized protein FVRRES_08118 [Fusarium venenatum]KAG8354260.1 hypothetical protein FVEN_g7690 [Fusarium venenatum]KAH6964904.1 hypothetical protein EDB82DRAFT_560781 [Fusarium venenatum]CEI68041.1 unnamed protein product [Fusarium venenatum]